MEAEAALDEVANEEPPVEAATALQDQQAAAGGDQAIRDLLQRLKRRPAPEADGPAAAAGASGEASVPAIASAGVGSEDEAELSAAAAGGAQSATTSSSGAVSTVAQSVVEADFVLEADLQEPLGVPLPKDVAQESEISRREGVWGGWEV